MGKEHTVRNVCSVICVPIRVLAARDGVQIQDRVNIVLRTQVDHSIEVLEAGSFQNAGVHIIYQ